MPSLRDAETQALEALRSVEWYGAGSGWMVDADAIEGAITALKAALAEPTGKENLQVGCDRCRSPLWAGTKCDVCGRKA